MAPHDISTIAEYNFYVEVSNIGGTDCFGPFKLRVGKCESYVNVGVERGAFDEGYSTD